MDQHPEPVGQADATEKPCPDFIAARLACQNGDSKIGSCRSKAGYAMRGTLIPLPSFLEAAIRACEDPLSTKRYLGIVVVLDRKAERSRLIKNLASGTEGSSINDVTRKDLLVALPGRTEDQLPGVDEWVLDPHKNWDGVAAPGLLLAGADDQDWASRLWEYVSEEVELCQNHEDQERLAQAIDQSASSVCDYLGLSEDDIPGLVLFSLIDRRVFVFRYGDDAHGSPYDLFKEIATHRPSDGQGNWLSSAVVDAAHEFKFADGPVPELKPASLAGWEATRYLPRRTDGQMSAHSEGQDGHKPGPMKRQLAQGGKWLAGAGGITALGYLATTESIGGKHPIWPYWLFAAMLIIGLVLYFTCQEHAETILYQEPT